MRGYRLTLLFVLLVSVLGGCGESVTAPEANGVWETSTPEAEGMDGDLLNQLTQKLASGDVGQISSFIVVRNGKLVYEQYLGGMTQTSRHAVYSVTKSVTSMLVGMSLARGEIEHLDQSVLSFFPNYVPGEEPGPRKSDITLRHLLQMRAGFRWDEFSAPYGSSQNPTSNLLNSGDWTRFILDQPLSDDPGSVFTYNSGCSVLLGSVLAQVAGGRASAVAKDRLFKPLGISDYRWEEGPSNVTNTGWGLHLRPRDMARLGQLYLQEGIWGGKQLIRADWIEASLQSYTDFQRGGGYGYQWWIMNLGDKVNPEYVPYADGYGGQFIFISRARNMVVVSTAEQFGNESTAIRQILTDYVFR